MIEKTIDDKCCTVVSDPLIQRSENGKSFRLKNPARKVIKCCIVDGCLLVDPGRKCDYLFVIVGEKLYLVELKGTSHVHALRQLIESAEKLQLERVHLEKCSVIVSSACPKATTSYQAELARLSHRFRRTGLAPPIKKNTTLEITV
jgi:hypothetical protein